MSTYGNKEWAADAAAALEVFSDRVGIDDDELLIQDLITNLGHLARDAKIDFVTLAARAISHWAYERRHPNGIGTTPQVTITVAGRRPKCARPDKAGVS